MHTAAAPLRLTEWTSCGGCAAKWGGSPLAALVRDVDAARPAIEELLVGLAPFDDAAVLRVAPGLALVATTDFFPPLVDDPADFGAIAAANACSDVFAMGGRVVLALNIAAFPERLPSEAIAAIFAAASSVVEEAGGVVAGGHTIRSEEPIFGLAVQGLVDPDRVLTKGGGSPGDVLVLSKPVGTGIVLAGGSDADRAAAIGGMRTLNRAASEALVAAGAAVRGATDVTGFGLAGHGWEMAERCGATVVIDTASVPLYGGALDAARRGVRTGGDARNRSYLDGCLEVGPGADADLIALCVDPQTSGGLLAAVDPAAVDDLDGFAVVGEIASGPPRVTLT